MSPRPKKAPAAAAPKGRPIRRSQPRAVAAPRDASAPDYSRTPLDAIPLAGLPPRALIAPNFRLYELSKSDLASQLTAKLLSLPERPTAVCVETDQVAIALVKELRKQQLNVPEDISVLGFDDAEIAQAADLSTIRQEPIELGRIAGRKVLQLLRNEPLEHPHELQDPLLVLRNTTSRIDSGAAPAE